MRPEIMDVLRRLHAAVKDEAALVAVDRADVERLISWVLAGDMREINAYSNGVTHSLATIRRLIPQGHGSSDGVHVCCRRAVDRINAYLSEDLQRWRAAKKGKALDERFRAIQSGQPHRR